MRTEQLPFTLEVSVFNFQAECERQLNSTNAELNNRKFIIKTSLTFYFGIALKAST